MNNNSNYQTGLVIGLIFMFIFTAFILLTKPVYGQAPVQHLPSIQYQQQMIDYVERETELQKQTLTDSILRMMTVWNNPNTNQPVYSAACRNSRFGCENTIRIYASYFVEIANQYENIDPYLLAATAKHESNYNAFAKGSRGERGIMQILPRSPISEGVMFIHRPSYRRQCQNTPGHCQEEVIQAAARALHRSITFCDNSINRALIRYNSGRCMMRGNRYSRHVQEIYRNLLSYSL